MKAVISGASGYLGSRLVSEFAQRGFKHVCGLILEPQILAHLLEKKEVDPTFSFVASDDWEGTREALAGADVLIHCAFPRAQAAEHLAAGLKYGNDLFIAAREAGCKAVINISSQSVYDAYRDYAATEDAPLVLDTTYAVGKYASELMLDDVYGGLPHTSVRLASLIGPGFDQRVPNKMVKKALAGEALEIKGGDQVFDYMDVRDAVDALCVLATSDPSGWDVVYNIGSSRPLTLLEMANVVLAACGGSGINITESEAACFPNSSLCCTRFRESFSWTPSFLFEETVQSIIAASL